LRNIDEEKVNKRNENSLSLIKEPWNSRSNNVKNSRSQKGPRYTRRNPILFCPHAMQLLSNLSNWTTISPMTIPTTEIDTRHHFLINKARVNEHISSAS
jgi:hypothetical protein